MNDIILQLALAVIPAVLAITLHEAAHGYAALALGDDTAKRAGRLSLNPLRHVDRVGTILLPGFLLIFQLLTIGRVVFMFGWAKPVPVAAWRFRNPRRGMAVVAAAGPADEFLPRLARRACCASSGCRAGRLGAACIARQFLLNFILINLVLGLFNLLPIPPLDGGRIVVGLLPRRWRRPGRGWSAPASCSCCWSSSCCRAALADSASSSTRSRQAARRACCPGRCARSCISAGHAYRRG